MSPGKTESVVDQIRFRCGNCLQTIKAKPEKAGKEARCPSCKRAVKVPSESVPTKQEEFDLAPISVDPDDSEMEQRRRASKDTQSRSLLSRVDPAGHDSDSDSKWVSPLDSTISDLRPPKTEVANASKPSKQGRTRTTKSKKSDSQIQQTGTVNDSLYASLERLAAILKLLGWTTAIVFGVLLAADLFGISLSETEEASDSKGLAYQFGVVVAAATLVTLQFGVSGVIGLLIDIHRKLKV